jgi:hypothetical protein
VVASCALFLERGLLYEGVGGAEGEEVDACWPSRALLARMRTVTGLAVILVTKDCSPRVHSLGSMPSSSRWKVVWAARDKEFVLLLMSADG